MRTIRAKLLTAFGSVLAITLMLAVLTAVGLTQVQSSATILKDRTSVRKAALTFKNDIGLLYSNQADLIINGTPEVATEYAANQKDLEQYLSLLTQSADTPEEKQWAEQLGQLTPRYVQQFEQTMATFRRRDQLSAPALSAAYKEIDDKTDAIKAQMFEFADKLADSFGAEADEASHALANAIRTTFALLIGLTLLALISGVAIALVFSGRLSDTLRQVAQAAEGIAVGELDHQIHVKTHDELGQMARSFTNMTTYLKEVASVATAIGQGDLSRTVTPKSERDQFGVAIAQMIRNLREVVTRVRAAAETVGAGSQQIANSSNELARTVSVQASSVEETSAAMEEMAANITSMDRTAQDLGGKVTTVRSQSDDLAAAVTQTSSSISELAASIQQVAGNVAHANQMSEQASEAALAGADAVAKTTNGMAAIAETMQGIEKTIRVLDERSGEIGAIIEVIDDIAEQTNLLALNAAIEAARAGEAGRGFAVVADEVRKLAERSAKATREIGDLIQGIQKETTQAVGVTKEGAAKVEDGVRLATHTSEALGKIKEAASQVTSLLNEVAAASSEQARASQQIVTAAEQMAAINHTVTGAVSEMDTMTRTVGYATGEQRQGIDQVVIAVESLSKSSQEASVETDQVSAAAASLNEQARLLQEAVGFFRLDEPATRSTLASGGGKVLSIPQRV